jgi:hypothetical protein
VAALHFAPSRQIGGIRLPRAGELQLTVRYETARYPVPETRSTFSFGVK